ncbi:sensor histidine kinase [Chitinophaga lutea]
MKDKYLAVYGSIITIAFQMIFFYRNIGILDFVTCTTFSTAIWLAARATVLYARRRVPGIMARRKRLLLIVGISLPVTVLITIGNALFEQALAMSTLSFYSLLATEGMTLLIAFVVVGIYEGLYYIQQWQQLHVQSEQLRRINAESQFKFLEDQIKPHFLFNSLNTLTSLIGTDPGKAELFTEEMSSVYRYLLRKNRRELTSLQDELAFVESYILMLKTRFDDALEVDIRIGEEYQHHLLPPFVLQLLLENAVKHNIATIQRPLCIRVWTDEEGNLYVENNLQKKDMAVYSERTGLLNLTERYRLLNREDDLYILEEEHCFRVVVPLIHKDQFSPIHTIPQSITE